MRKTSVTLISLFTLVAVLALPRSTFAQDTREVEGRPPATPPVSFLVSYGTFAALQGLDASTTLRAVSLGAVEKNPVMRWSVDHPPAMFLMKAVTTAGTIALVERVRRDHPKRAMAIMIAVNLASSALVIHNYRVINRLR
jgi:hypothetical protein